MFSSPLLDNSMYRMWKLNITHCQPVKLHLFFSIACNSMEFDVSLLMVFSHLVLNF